MKKQFRVRIHPASIALLAGAFLFLPSDQVLASAMALLWHEAAHLLAMRLCGVGMCCVELTPFGGMADVRQFEELSPMKQAVCAGAGVAASLGGAWLSRNAQNNLMVCLFQCHLSLGLFNALPMWPLDGGRVCVALASWLGFERRMRKLLSHLSSLVGILLVFLGLYGAWHGSINFSLLLAGPYLCYASQMGNVGERLRKIGYALERDVPLAAVQAFVTDEKHIERLLPGLIGRFSKERYHLLIQLDQDKKSLKKVWPEHELIRMAVNQPTIPSTSGVDKTNAL